mgnify:CR=1 FL=1
MKLLRFSIPHTRQEALGLRARLFGFGTGPTERFKVADLVQQQRACPSIRGHLELAAPPWAKHERSAHDSIGIPRLLWAQRIG